MSIYLSSIYKERRESAQSRMEELIALQKGFCEKSASESPYSISDREADCRAIDEAMQRFTSACNAMREIETDAKSDGLVPCRRCNALLAPMDVQGHVCNPTQPASL